MKVPTHLSHKPVITVEDYEPLDGHHKTSTDAKALSIGKAQYDENEFSAKVFRYNDNSKRWSPQSEELPLHRVIDLSILIVSTLDRIQSDNPNQETSFSSYLNEKKIANVTELSNFLNSISNELKPKLNELKILINKITI